MGNYLVCYFSPTGTTMTAARQIAAAVKADQLQIQPKEPYTENDLNWRKYFSRCNREHRRKKLPEVGFHMFNLAQYGVVFLGFPIWYETAPNLILSFLKSNDWSGQRLILFATSGGSGIRQAQDDIRAFLNGHGEIPAAEILDPSEPEKNAAWAKDVLAAITRDERTAAEEYVSRNYEEPAPPPPAEKPSGGGKFSRESDVKFSSVLTRPRESELEKLRRENEQLRLLLQDQSGRIPRSPLDRYNSGAIERAMRSTSAGTPRSTLSRTLDTYTDQSFVGKLTALIREKGMKEPDVYRAAQIDRKLFSKIISDQNYKPAKDTCVALSYALKLSLPEAADLLSRAGYTLSHSNKRDVILEYFFSAGQYNLFDINEVLLQLDQRPLGRQS